MSRTERSPFAWWQDEQNSADHRQKHERRNKRLRRRKQWSLWNRRPIERRATKALKEDLT